MERTLFLVEFKYEYQYNSTSKTLNIILLNSVKMEIYNGEKKGDERIVFNNIEEGENYLVLQFEDKDFRIRPKTLLVKKIDNLNEFLKLSEMKNAYRLKFYDEHNEFYYDLIQLEKFVNLFPFDNDTLELRVRMGRRFQNVSKCEVEKYYIISGIKSREFIKKEGE
jgi:hypothetical protein